MFKDFRFVLVNKRYLKDIQKELLESNSFILAISSEELLISKIRKELSSDSFDSVILVQEFKPTFKN
jgi:hypothetical protein